MFPFRSRGECIATGLDGGRICSLHCCKWELYRSSSTPNPILIVPCQRNEWTALWLEARRKWERQPGHTMRTLILSCSSVPEMSDLDATAKELSPKVETAEKRNEQMPGCLVLSVEHRRSSLCCQRGAFSSLLLAIPTSHAVALEQTFSVSSTGRHHPFDNLRCH